jgi:beta-1,4-N-acetylglucosaminyltransferase
VDWWSYRPSLAEELRAADLVISHAGAGTCLEVLELGKPLVVIVNQVSVRWGQVR